MPCSYVIDKELRLVRTTAWDVLTAAEAMEHQNRLRSDATFDPAFSQLIDGIRVTEVKVTSEEVRVLAARNVFSPQSRRAFVAGHAELFGMLRMFQAYRELSGAAERIRVFYDLAEAQKWLSSGL